MLTRSSPSVSSTLTDNRVKCCLGMMTFRSAKKMKLLCQGNCLKFYFNYLIFSKRPVFLHNFLYHTVGLGPNFEKNAKTIKSAFCKLALRFQFHFKNKSTAPTGERWLSILCRCGGDWCVPLPSIPSYRRINHTVWRKAEFQFIFANWNKMKFSMSSHNWANFNALRFKLMICKLYINTREKYSVFTVYLHYIH